MSIHRVPMTPEEARTPGATVIPTIRYRDAPAAIEWLCNAFGFRKHLVVPGENGQIRHAQLTFGNGMVMLGSARADSFGEFQAPLPSVDAPVSQSPYIVVDDVSRHFERARSEGAIIVSEPQAQAHGGHLYSCRDPEGNLWNFGSYDPWRQSEQP